MHVYVQKSTSTTFPRRPSGVSGSELSQPVAPSKPGRRVSARGLAKRLTSRLLAAVEKVEQEQEHVEDVEEDRGGQQRCGANVLRPPQTLEVVHRESGEDYETGDRIDQRAVRDVHEDGDDPEDNEDEERPEAHP